jgi:hypothetical protein
MLLPKKEKRNYTKYLLKIIAEGYDMILFFRSVGIKVELFCS